MKQVNCRLILFFCILMSACSGVKALPEPSPQQTDSPISTEVPTLVSIPSPAEQPTDENLQDLLFIWGRSKEWPNGECRIWVLDPENQLEQIHPLIGKQDCNYKVVEIDEKEYFVSLPHWNPAIIENPAEIVLYDVTVEGELVVQQSIPMGDIHLTSLTNVPQWAADGSVYLAGILNGKEQIFRYDSQARTFQTYLDSSNGFITSPLLSPDGRYLAYMVVENNESSDQCDRGTCYRRYYHVWDIYNKRDIELLPLIEPWISGEPYFMHCELEWSPTGRFVAFDVGCGLQEPSSVAIIDVENEVVAEVINAENFIRKYEWLSDDQLIVSGTTTFASTNEDHDGYMLYLADTRAWIPLENIPERNIYDYDLIAFNDWTEDGAFTVGQTQVPGEKRTVDLVIFEVEDKESEGQYIRVSDEFVDSPLWSTSNNFISYRSYNWETESSRSRFTIIASTGEILLDTGMINVISPNFAWFTKS